MNNVLLAYKKYTTNLTSVLANIDDDQLTKFVALIKDAHTHEQTVFIIGNGGSASTASHWATDLGKGLHHRKDLGVKALSLADNMSWISAAANDIAFDSVFSDQLRAHGKAGDLLISISASGESPNVIKAIGQAKKLQMTTLAIVGFDGGTAKQVSDYAVHIPTPKGHYGVVEDIQLILNHFLCDYIAGELA
jgi:D-sedoheptulose 7-phosphate isomerase